MTSTIEKTEADYAAEDAIFAIAATNRARFAYLRAAAEDFAPASEAIDAAEYNAIDTIAENDFEHYRLAEFALASIASTSPYVERADVREWFAAHGFKG